MKEAHKELKPNNNHNTISTSKLVIKEKNLLDKPHTIMLFVINMPS